MGVGVRATGETVSAGWGAGAVLVPMGVASLVAGVKTSALGSGEATTTGLVATGSGVDAIVAVAWTSGVGDDSATLVGGATIVWRGVVVVTAPASISPTLPRSLGSIGT